jgi:hypothetical protein
MARDKTACRLHALVADVVLGGISKEDVVSQVLALLEGVAPTGAAAVERHRLALTWSMISTVSRPNARRPRPASGPQWRRRARRSWTSSGSVTWSPPP